MRRARCRLVLSFAALALLAGCKDCDPDTRFLAAYREAILYPERFQAYIDANRASFDGRFVECAGECDRRLEREIQAATDSCYELWSWKPDWLNDCLFEDVTPFVLFQNNVRALSAILRSPSPVFTSSELYAVLIQQKSANPARHMSENGQVIDLIAPLLTCRQCRTSFLGVDF
jgi:hypothetical protein